LSIEYDEKTALMMTDHGYGSCLWFSCSGRRNPSAIPVLAQIMHDP
jgi:hypothetical protein